MQILGTEEVGELLGINAATVLKYLHWCQPGGRYEHNPFPKPAGTVSRVYYWTADQVPEIVAWKKKRAGTGARTDIKRKREQEQANES